MSRPTFPQRKGDEVSEPEHDEETELVEPVVADVPEPDQEPGEEEAEVEAEVERTESPEVEVEPEAHGPTPEEWEARHKEADKAFTTYTNKVGRIYEEEANDYLPCPLCADTPAGFIHPGSVGTFPDEVVGAVMVVLGQQHSGSMESDPYSAVCSTCKGWGLVTTGSKVPNQETRQCLDCKGLGYVPEGPTVAGTNGQNATLELVEQHQRVPAAVGVESPEVESLRLRGYTIIPPMQTSAP